MFDANAYAQLLQAVDAAATAAEKGKSLEDLSAYLFDALDGVEVVERDLQLPAEEIDLVVWNAQLLEELRVMDPIILVECKNWSSPVGAPEVGWFIHKVRNKNLKTGILIAARGVTGRYGQGGDRGARGVITSALQDGIRILTLTLDDLRAITSTDDLRALLKRRYCGVFVGKMLN